MLPRLCLSPSLISPEAVGSSVHAGILSVFPFSALESSSKSGGTIKPWRTGSTTGPAFKRWRTENVAKFSRVLSCGRQVLEGQPAGSEVQGVAPSLPCGSDLDNSLHADFSPPPPVSLSLYSCLCLLGSTQELSLLIIVIILLEFASGYCNLCNVAVTKIHRNLSG